MWKSVCDDGDVFDVGDDFDDRDDDGDASTVSCNVRLCVVRFCDIVSVLFLCKLIYVCVL